MLPSGEARLCIARPPRSSSKAFFASARDAAVPKCAKHCASFVLAVWDVGSFRQLPRTRTASSQRFKGQKRVTKESPEASRIGLALPALRKSGKELLETLPESPQNPIRAIPRGFWQGKSDSQGAKEIARCCRDSTFNAEFLTASGGCFASHSNHFKGLTKTESVTVSAVLMNKKSKDYLKYVDEKYQQNAVQEAYAWVTWWPRFPVTIRRQNHNIIHVQQVLPWKCIPLHCLKT